MSKVTQVDLVSEVTDGEGWMNMTTWLDADPRIKQDALVRLKGDTRWWKVEKVYSTEDKHTIDSNRGWDNNNYDKHDGTSMKDRAKK